MAQQRLTQTPLPVRAQHREPLDPALGRSSAVGGLRAPRRSRRPPRPPATRPRTSSGRRRPARARSGSRRRGGRCRGTPPRSTPWKRAHLSLVVGPHRSDRHARPAARGAVRGTPASDIRIRACCLTEDEPGVGQRRDVRRLGRDRPGPHRVRVVAELGRPLGHPTHASAPAAAAGPAARAPARRRPRRSRGRRRSGCAGRPSRRSRRPASSASQQSRAMSVYGVGERLAHLVGGEVGLADGRDVAGVHEGQDRRHVVERRPARASSRRAEPFAHRWSSVHRTTNRRPTRSSGLPASAGGSATRAGRPARRARPVSSAAYAWPASASATDSAHIRRRTIGPAGGYGGCQPKRHRAGLPLRPGDDRLQRGEPARPHRHHVHAEPLLVQQVQQHRGPRARAPCRAPAWPARRRTAAARRRSTAATTRLASSSSRASRGKPPSCSMPQVHSSCRCQVATSIGGGRLGGRLPAVDDGLGRDEADGRGHRLGPDLAERSGPRRHVVGPAGEPQQARPAQRLRRLGEGTDDRRESRFGVGGSLFGGHPPDSALPDRYLENRSSRPAGRNGSIRLVRFEILQGRLHVAHLPPGGGRLPLGGAPGQLAPGDVGLRLGTPPLQLGQLGVEVLDQVIGVPLGGLGPFQLLVGPAARRPARRSAPGAARACAARAPGGAARRPSRSRSAAVSRRPAPCARQLCRGQLDDLGLGRVVVRSSASSSSVTRRSRGRGTSPKPGVAGRPDQPAGAHLRGDLRLGQRGAQRRLDLAERQLAAPGSGRPAPAAGRRRPAPRPPGGAARSAPATGRPAGRAGPRAGRRTGRPAPRSAPAGAARAG